ncbi:MAG: 5-oxoprolinase subunit PxpB [Terrimonas sp.]|nr:5-oxoprolinase subunit PxpB [Terrimonas sp.]
MDSLLPYRIYANSESAITIDFGNHIDRNLNRRVLAIHHFLQANPLEGMVESVPAYSSLTVYFDILAVKKHAGEETASRCMEEALAACMQKDIAHAPDDGILHRIPVCYDEPFAPDLSLIIHEKNISRTNIIDIHCERTYHVFMMGFLPGFAYMGEIDTRIAMPRKKQPAKRVEAGSVGIAGRQTGIYPLHSPGGWQIIGRTPVPVFDPFHEPVCLLKAGDQVQFYSISSHEFEHIKSRYS